ncbi:Conserved hypothetical protein, DUF285 family [Mycoplasma mycoides subsp. capri LC str. 95010]|uniref:BspA family leucine-rich repeat surface protein n=1 Tax=Mycoplasma mycoides subsp. capri LC str. 95010 TaxID=862259 RepID=F4MPQ3_MYCML|nr:BspA family leucine-rich repeat surface protein [Mycoplasma mycoides]CBW54085.1 Conserved hypothetical protein, DUF285 family [Mycoplasma mycoides subsp. capri LC str. 95010]
MMNKIIKQPVYNADRTECLEIGYEWYDNQISIIPFPHTIKKVPRVLPTQITSLENAFIYNQNEFIDGIEYWDTSNITNMYSMFYEANNFNQNISMWDVSSVVDMSYMFCWAYKFNQDISNWNVSNVKYMNDMFYCANNFNQNISKWNVSNVKKDYQNIGSGGFNWKDEFKPKFNK